MLEIRDLTKVYKTKGGAEVRALDGVSVRFEEKGMVFLLGKSGSGKSTLLNLCGGLDSPDSGEIIIKGRSSKDFTQSDFDSYRNTFVGFVFQEYNILNEFTVEDNIALALELQGKNKNKEQVREILAQVELENFAKRKPNTLSGGQKQRVAIARALVKNPEIIMADEPTGALDSNTGKQVFDTLKKLSETKLVIVVSHDREFAEIYGDRIIELKDGKIISDVTKTKIQAVSASENVRFIGEDTISVKSGAKLTPADIDRIQRFLTSSSNDVIITNGEKEIADFRKAARIDENGAREAFKTTDETRLEQKPYTEKDSRFIRSKLPARHAMRIGASGMKVKPFRLIFTILLSFIAFTLFGLFSTLTFYDPAETAVETYTDAPPTAMKLKKRYRLEYVNYENGEEYSRWESYNDTSFTPADLAAYREEYGSGAVGLFDYAGGGSRFSVYNAGGPASSYYSTELTGFAVFDAASSYWQELLLTSQTDLAGLKEDDAVISSYVFDALKNSGLYEGENLETSVKLDTYDSIVGKKLYLRSPYGGNDFIQLNVAGVYRMDLPEKYDMLKDDTPQQDTQELQYALSNELNYGLYQTMLVSDAFYDAHYNDFGGENNDYVDYGFTALYREAFLPYGETDEGEELNIYIGEVNSLPALRGQAPDAYFFDGRSDMALQNGEIVLSYDPLSSMIESDFYKYMEDQRLLVYENPDATDEDHQRLQELEEQYNEILNRWQTEQMLKYHSFLRWGEYEEYSEDTGEHITVYPTEKDYRDALAAVVPCLQEMTEFAGTDRLTQTFDLRFGDSAQAFASYTIKGFYYGSMCRYTSGIYMSKTDFDSLITAANEGEGGWYQEQETKYEEPEDAIYNYIAIPFPDSQSALRSLLNSENSVSETDDTYYTIYTEISDQLSMVNDMIGTFKQVFLWVGVVMAVFAMLLLFNFISVSITYKKKEIGILRAVGARSADVFKIFYSESAIITAICYVLAMIASFIVCFILNNELAGSLGATIFVFGPLSWLVMLGIALVTSFIATFLPVYGIAKRRPVESIRAL